MNKTPVDIASEWEKGRQYHQAGQLPKAAAAFKKTLSADPKHHKALHMLGFVYYQTGKIQEAIDLMNRSVQVDTKNPLYYHSLGNVLNESGRTAEAISCYQKVIQLNPNVPSTYHNMGEALQSNGKFEEAISCYRKALELKPDFALAFYGLALAKKNTSKDMKYLVQLSERLIDNQITEDDLILKNFALGKIHHDLEAFDKAFEYYRHGNKLEHKKHKFSIESHVKFVSRIIEKFSVEFVTERRSWGMNTKTPIFVFGMPRSGTTLVDKIVSSHPKVFSVGESGFFFQLEHTLEFGGGLSPYPEYLDRIDSRTAHSISESYLGRLRDSITSSEHYTKIVDKMPHNFLVLGLLFILFPKARFIHCHRNPLDNCLSIYFHKFREWHDYAYDLDDIGLYYKEYQRLMDHWRRVLPTILDIKYEELVHRQEEISRKLIQYCELEWDSGCLDFYKNRSSTSTTMWEVRQSMFTSSIDRWKEYAQFVGPLKTLFANCL